LADAFRVEFSRQGRRLIAAPFGEIDLATAPVLVRGIENELATEPADRVVVDLSEASFLDSSALDALVRLQRQLTRDGIGLRLVSPADRIVRQVFEITHLTGELGVVESLDDALRP
jgi:anti-sigma B factor antagonist